MTAYDPSQWTDLFVATTGGAAALAGLVFVAVSINVERILHLEGIPERALETVLTLLAVVIVSIACLIPGQSTAALGLELLAIALAYTFAVTALARRSLPTDEAPFRWRVGRIVVSTLGAAPLLIGAVSLIAETGGGLYWVVASIAAAICGAVANAWVLLVEILR
jgi:modulator of FtsH protease